MESVLKFKKMSQNATTPYRGSAYSIGLDLFSAYDYIIDPNHRTLCMTDIIIELPQGCYGRIAPRSGLAVKHSIDVGAGVVDPDYRGNVGILLINFGTSSFIVKKGDKIAQIFCEKCVIPTVIEVEHVSETERGISGFGSTD